MCAYVHLEEAWVYLSVSMPACRTCQAGGGPKHHFSVKLEPGDIEILHNPSALHSRAEVVDGEMCASILLCAAPSCMICNSLHDAPDGQMDTT